MTCNECNTPLERIDMFPGRLCLLCYSQTKEGNRLLTDREIIRMWGGRA